MMKSLTIKVLLLASLLLTGFATPKAEYDVKPAFDLIKSIYSITSTVNGVYSQGSGFMIDGVFVTNYHVSGGGEGTVVHADQDIPVDEDDVVFSDESLDIIAYDIKAGESLKSGSPSVYGAKVFAIGYPRNKLSISEGYVVAVMKKYGIKMVVSRITTDYGSSGGVLLNQKGEVVGITTRMSEDKKNNEAIPIDYVLKKMEG